MAVQTMRISCKRHTYRAWPFRAFDRPRLRWPCPARTAVAETVRVAAVACDGSAAGAAAGIRRCRCWRRRTLDLGRTAASTAS